MNKNKMLLLLAISMIIGGCKDNSKNKIYKNPEMHVAARANSNKGLLNDTLFVVGVLHQPSAAYNGARKYLKFVNKQGTVYDVEINLMQDANTVMSSDRDAIISYIERGDTIVVENGVIVKNITMDNMINRYVNGR